MFSHPRDFNYFHVLKKSSSIVFDLLQKTVGINTFFIAVNDQKTNYFIDAFNRNETLVEVGTTLPFSNVY
ncbi:hypothetical protein [Bacillus sp. AK128]